MRKKFHYQLGKKYRYLRNVKLTTLLCFLLLGFLTGNLFGTTLDKARGLFYWDGFIIFFLVALLEFVSYAAYGKHTKSVSFFNVARAYKKFVRAGLTFARQRAPLAEGLHMQELFQQEDTAKEHHACFWFWKLANFFKIGIMIGFFVDAFKVGS